jgi:NAD(P)-dependent dehydrogenase (short-subunit alcohol dehydrogenase family)
VATDLPLAGRLALVTGASRGIGRAVAFALAQGGAHVLALARSADALEELDDQIKAVGGSATLVPCDVTDWPALDRLAQGLTARAGRLDILVGNAGYLGPLTPLAQVDPRQWDRTLAVNVTANLRLLRALDPLLRASDAGRVVMLTSGAAHRAQMKPYWGAYAMAKSATETLVRTYAAETANVTAIRAMAVNPGPLRTRMRAQAMPGEDPATLRTPAELAPKVVELCLPSWTRTGMLYDFPTDRVLSWQAPA